MGMTDFARKVYDRTNKANLSVLVHECWTDAEYNALLQLGNFRKGWHKSGGFDPCYYDLLGLIIERRPEMRFEIKMLLLSAKRREELAA